MSVRVVNGKIQKGNAMLSNPVLRPHIPETYPYKWVTARKMMGKYRTLFIKPDKGSGGSGIVRMRRLSSGKIEISWGLRHREFPETKAVWALHRLLQLKRTYLVQQGLELGTFKNRIFDIRVFMQKPHSEWFISGKVVRVGAFGKFVTNYSQGALPKTIEEVFSSVYKNQPNKAVQTIRHIEKLCLALAKTLDRKFPGIRELGVDVAIDRKGHIWIIEANTAPKFQTFKRLRNKTMYQRIVKRHRYIYKH